MSKWEKLYSKTSREKPIQHPSYTQEKNMSETIKCPSCNTMIDVSNVLRKKLAAEAKEEFEREIKAAVHNAQQGTKAEMQLLQKRLDEANNNELQLRKQKTELEQKAKDMDLEVQRRLDQEKAALEQRVSSRISEDHRMKDAEKDKKISDALAQVEELRRKMEQGSQQVQGEVFELEIESSLTKFFPEDRIEPVAKGVKGGDIVHTVQSKSGSEAGKILWELKRTKSFSSLWISKLKADMREVRAHVAILVTEAMPEGVLDCIRYEGNIWVVSLRFCFHLCFALRTGMLWANSERDRQDGKKDKAVLVYEYLTGHEFRGRVQAIIESYSGMQVDLEAEKRAVEKIWAKRQKQIDVVIKSLAGMHGEIEAIAAGELPSIPTLSLEKI